MISKHRVWILGALLVMTGLAAQAADGIGKIKSLSGQVMVTRGNHDQPATLGDTVYQSDRITTGRDGAVGLLFNDDSRLALGPNTMISLEKFAFDFETNDGGFDVAMNRGTLSVISGKLVQKTPGALKVKTPAAILAVRGTEFSVKVDPTTGIARAPN